MFGAPAFGSFAFGQVAGLTFTPLAASATITIGVDNTFRQESFFYANLTVSIGTVAAVALEGAIAASAGFTFGATATLSAPQPLAAQATITWGTDRYLFDPGIFDGTAVFDTGSRLTAALTVTGPLVGDARVSVGSSAALRPGGWPLAATGDTTIAIGVASARLSSLPATFTAHPEIHVGAVGNLVKIGASATDPVFAFNGALTSAIRRGSLVITDILNEAPNTCDFITDDAPPPAIGTDVKIGLQNFSPSNLLFAGTVRRVDRLYELRQENPSWAISCLDYTWLINRRKVFGTWTDTSATTVATQIVTQCTSGFSTAGIVGGLPTITVTFNGEDVMDALTQVANLVGGYTKVDYGKVVRLFITDPGTPPHPIDGTVPKPMNLPAMVHTQDETQVRTRVYVRGDAVAVVGPSEQAIPPGSAQIPIDDGTIFSSGQVMTDDARILSYGGTAPGGQSATVVGNVPGPSSGGIPALAPGVAGELDGTYRWAVAFANDAGETPIGPPTGPLFCPAFATPGAGPGLGVAGTAGPLVGAYQYRVAFLTTLGETLPGPIVSRTAIALTPPQPNTQSGPPGYCRLAAGTYSWRVTYVTEYGETMAGPPVTITQQPAAFAAAPSVAHGIPPGPLLPGQFFNYGIGNVTADGETLIGALAGYTANAVSIPTLTLAQPLSFGGILGGPYAIAMTVVTGMGESAYLTAGIGTGHFTGAPSGLRVPGNFDTTGRITPGRVYSWAATNFHDTYGETALSGASSINTFGTTPLAILVILPTTNWAGNSGTRLYRTNNTIDTWQLVAEFRGNVAGMSYWDRLSDSELGDQYPRQTTPPGVSMRYQLTASSEADVRARRIYRTRAGGTEYFLVGEIQTNNPASTLTEGYFDTELTQRVPPGPGATGRTVQVTIPTGPVGTIARRLYRTKAGGGLLYQVAEISDNTLTTWLDQQPDTALTKVAPGLSTAGSNGIPRLVIPAGPAGVIARRLYRTAVNGSEYRLIAEVPGNLSTIYDDNESDAQRESAAPPISNTHVGEAHQLTGIATGPIGTLARVLYRTKAGGATFYALDRISDNTTTTYLDTVPDTALGTDGVQLTNSAGASAVVLSAIPIGPSSVKRRIIYRTKAGGSAFFYVGTIEDNNPATTFLDTRGDTALGRAPEPTSTIGALAGDGTLALDTTAGWPLAGWIRAGSQYLRYTGISGNTLTGIPTARVVTRIDRIDAAAFLTMSAGHGILPGDRITVSGADQTAYNGVKLVIGVNATQASYAVQGAPVTPATGATLRATPVGGILAPIPGRTIVETVAMLTGVSGMGTPLLVGDRLALWVTVNSAAGQAALAATEGGDGVHEYVITDATLRSVDACTKRGLAELKLFEFVPIEFSYTTRDPLTRTGPLIHVAASAGAGFAGDFRIQNVRIDEIGMWVRTYPRYTVTASNTKHSLADILRHVVLDR